MKLTKQDKQVIEMLKRRRADGHLPSRRTYQPKNSKEAVKMSLCESIVLFRQKENIQQKELATMAGLTEPQLSEIMNYRIEKFTIDFLLDAIDKINACKRVGHSIQVAFAKVAV